MIRFACMYCGRKIRAKDGSRGKRAHCPACGHDLMIPNPPDDIRKSAPVSATSAGEEKARLWEGRSNKEIARLLLRKNLMTPEERIQVAAKGAVSPLLPRYDDLTLFVLSVAFLILVGINPEIKAALPQTARFMVDGRMMILLGLAAIGMVFSLFGIFFKGPKPDLVKWPMLIFAVLVTAGTGICAGVVAVRHTEGWLLIFPTWNIINGVLLLLVARAGLLDTGCIIDRTPTFAQVVVALVCVGVLLGVCEHLFKLHWAITYSICVGYTMGLHHGITSVFGAATVEPS